MTTEKEGTMSPAIAAARGLVMALLLGPVVLLASPARSYAQHGNYLLGSEGLLGGSQAPEGIYYQNLFSYYASSGSGNLDASRARSLELLGRQLNLTVNGSFNRNSSLDVYVDQNIFGVTTPLKLLGANYGLMVDVPFAQVTGSGTDNRGSAIPNPLRGIKSNIFGVGPEIAATTKIGRFFARYEFEFGAQNAPEGKVFLFGWAALWDPFK